MRIFLAAFCFLFLSRLSAQEEPFRYTEKEISVQDKFVEAKKYTLIGRFEKAEEVLKSLYKENRSNAAISLELSKIYSYMEDPYNEHKYAKTAYKYQSNNEYVIAHFAKICMDQNKTNEAIPLLEQLVAMQPQKEEYTDKLATSYLQNNNAEKAIAAYDAIQKLIGISENVSRRKFEIYTILNAPKKAIEELTTLSNAFPFDKRFKHNLASYLQKEGKVEEALTVYKEILKIDINDAQANMAIMTSQTGAGNENNYLRSLTPIIENTSIPVDRKILELVPYLEKLNMSYDQELADALVMLTGKIATIHPTEAKAFALKGDVLRVTGNMKGASKAYTKTIELDDRNFLVWEGLMETYSEVEDYNSLKSIATEALDLFPNKPAAYMYFGRAYTFSKDFDEAQDMLKEGLMVSGKNSFNICNINAELARMYMMQGDMKSAEMHITKALEISKGKSGLAYEIKGDITAKKGNQTEAKKMWTKAQKLGIKSNRLQQKIRK